MARLFHVPLSPFCRKVRLSLAEKKIEVDLIEERYWERDPDFMRRNPAGKVPVLRLDGVMMSESAAICEYIEETRPDPSLMPKDAVARQEVRRLVSWFDGFIDQVVQADPRKLVAPLDEGLPTLREQVQRLRAATPR